MPPMTIDSPNPGMPIQRVVGPAYSRAPGHRLRLRLAAQHQPEHQPDDPGEPHQYEQLTHPRHGAIIARPTSSFTVVVGVTGGAARLFELLVDRGAHVFAVIDPEARLVEARD